MLRCYSPSRQGTPTLTPQAILRGGPPWVHPLWARWIQAWTRSGEVRAVEVWIFSRNFRLLTRCTFMPLWLSMSYLLANNHLKLYALVPTCKLTFLTLFISARLLCHTELPSEVGAKLFGALRADSSRAHWSAAALLFTCLPSFHHKVLLDEVSTFFFCICMFVDACVCACMCICVYVCMLFLCSVCALTRVCVCVCAWWFVDHLFHP